MNQRGACRQSQRILPAPKAQMNLSALVALMQESLSRHRFFDSANLISIKASEQGASRKASHVFPCADGFAASCDSTNQAEWTRLVFANRASIANLTDDRIIGEHVGKLGKYLDDFGIGKFPKIKVTHCRGKLWSPVVSGQKSAASANRELKGRKGKVHAVVLKVSLSEIEL